MDKKQGDYWYQLLLSFVQVEYGLKLEEAEEIINIASSYNLNDACSFFNFIQDEIMLISVWDKRKFKVGINSKLLMDYVDSQIDEDKNLLDDKAMEEKENE